MEYNQRSVNLDFLDADKTFHHASEGLVIKTYYFPHFIIAKLNTRRSVLIGTNLLILIFLRCFV